MNEIVPANLPGNDRPTAFSERPATVQDAALIFWRHLWLVALLLVVCTVTAAVISQRTPKAWQANAQLLLVQQAPVVTASSQTVAVAPMVESIDTQISLLQSHALASLAAQRVGIDAETLQKATTVSVQKDGDNVIDLTVESGSRQDAINWANALCQAFVQYKQQVAQRNSQETLATLKDQAAQGQAQVRRADGQLLAFEKTHALSGIGILDASAQKTAALNAVLAQNAVVADLQNQFAAAQAKSGALQNQLQSANQAIKTSANVRDDNETIKLEENLQDLEMQRVQIAQRYKLKFPGKLAPLDAQIADVKARLHQAIRGTLQSNPSLQAQGALAEDYGQARADALSAQVRLNAALQQRSLLQRQTTDLPQISMEADNLTQAAAQAHALYNSLNAAVQAAQIDQDAASGNVQIVQPAFAPAAPFRPSHKRDILVGLGVGLFLSLIAVLLLEQGDRSIRNPDDVRRLAEGPIVAVLPQMTRSQRFRFSRGEAPPQLIETLNAVRADFSLAARRGAGAEGAQVILVSSAVSGEGKTLTASELARSFARAGHRVALVNADMRRPSSLPLLRSGAGSPGLAEVLTGTATLKEALSPTEVPNLSVLHSGVAKRNPMDLISQPQMAETIRALRETADIVVIDSPPAAIVSDALLLAPSADFILYVVGVGMVDSDTLRNTAAALSAASLKRLSYFVNRAPQAVATSQYYQEYHQAASRGDETRNYNPWRTMSLDRQSLWHDGAQAPEARAAPSPDFEPNTAAAQMGGEKVGEDTVIWARPPVRVLPEIGSHLVALEGPYFGQKFALSPSRPLTIGILPDNDIVLARDGTISRRHARVAAEEGGYVVYDAGATNGTFVNDSQVTRQMLQVGDVVQFGASKFRYE